MTLSSIVRDDASVAENVLADVLRPLLEITPGGELLPHPIFFVLSPGANQQKPTGYLIEEDFVARQIPKAGPGQGMSSWTFANIVICVSYNHYQVYQHHIKLPSDCRAGGDYKTSQIMA